MITYDIRFFFHTRWIWFDLPHDVPGVDEIAFLSYDRVDAPGFKLKEGTTTILDLTLPEPSLWQGMRESFVRRQIQKGERAGIRVDEGTLDEFIPLYAELRRAKGLARNSLRFLSGTARVRIARENGRALAGGVFLGDGTHVRAYALASSRFALSDGRLREHVGWANRMVLWDAMRLFRQEGYRYLDLGGIDSDSSQAGERSLAEFKEAFGGVRTPYYFYRKTYSQVLRSWRSVRIFLRI